MSLDDFKEDSGVKIQDDKCNTDSGDDVETKPFKGTSKVERDPAESYEHYESKCLAALQLSGLGYEVTGEKDIDGKDVRADLYAEADAGVSGFDKDGTWPDDIIVEVGMLDAERARKFNESCDTVLWLEKSSGLSNAFVVSISNIIDSHNNISAIDSEHMKDISYFDQSGCKFNPKIQNLYIDKYKELGEKILLEFNDAREFTVDDIKQDIELNEYNMTDADVRKVLEVIGFI